MNPRQTEKGRNHRSETPNQVGCALPPRRMFSRIMTLQLVHSPNHARKTTCLNSPKIRQAPLRRRRRRAGLRRGPRAALSPEGQCPALRRPRARSGRSDWLPPPVASPRSLFVACAERAAFDTHLRNRSRKEQLVVASRPKQRSVSRRKLPLSVPKSSGYAVSPSNRPWIYTQTSCW